MEKDDTKAELYGAFLFRVNIPRNANNGKKLALQKCRIDFSENICLLFLK